MITALNMLILAIAGGLLACFAVWVWLQPNSYPENHEHVSGDFK